MQVQLYNLLAEVGIADARKRSGGAAQAADEAPKLG